LSTLPIGSQFGSYHIVRHIGGGGMAQIYLAKTRGLAGFEKYLALKVINPDLADDDRFIQMLIDEAKLTVGLAHVNIAQVFDLGKVGNIYYIAMEFVDGIDVLELVNGLHALGEMVPVEAAAYIGRQMCSGLYYAHSRRNKQGQPLNIVHRDISPQNILVSCAGEVKVVDFGIAKAAGMSAKTQAGVIKGKVHYMSPEQAMGEPADKRSDIFSAGIVLWEMLTSRMAYSGDNVKELVERVRKADIPPPSMHRTEIPASMDAIVAKALSATRDGRYQNGHGFQVALTRFLSSCATEYSGSHLAKLVERVLAGKRKSKPKDQLDQRLSKEDMIQDNHSVISSAANLGDGGGPPDKHRVLIETDQGKVVQVLESELVIGRAGQLTIPDARVSRRHARIFLDASGYVVEDLGSSNGTFVNGQKIGGPIILRNNDVVRIGSCHLRYLTPSAEPAEVVPPPVPEPAPPPPPPEPRLLISCGNGTVEKALDGEFMLEYEVMVGPVRLQGVSGRVSSRTDGYWLEPIPGRQPVIMGGMTAKEAVRLAPGDTFQVGEFSFQFQI